MVLGDHCVDPRDRRFQILLDERERERRVFCDGAASRFGRQLGRATEKNRQRRFVREGDPVQLCNGVFG